MMYTVYDFINDEIPTKRMRFGWKIEMTTRADNTCSHIVLRYIMLNFDWSSLNFINNELWNMFLSSKSYENMKKRIDRAELKFKRTYFEACSIEHLKWMMNNAGLEIDLDKLIANTREKISKQIKEKIENKLSGM